MIGHCPCNYVSVTIEVSQHSDTTGQVHFKAGSKAAKQLNECDSLRACQMQCTVWNDSSRQAQSGADIICICISLVTTWLCRQRAGQVCVKSSKVRWMPWCYLSLESQRGTRMHQC